MAVNVTTRLWRTVRLFRLLFVTSQFYPLFRYLFATPLLCSRLQLSPLLFVTSLYCFFKVSIVSLSVCYVTALFSASIVPSSVYGMVFKHLYSAPQRPWANRDAFSSI